jgi:hypothetical protein
VTSKISRSTAAAGMAAILTFGLASVDEAAAARVHRAHRQPHTVRTLAAPHNGNGAYNSNGLYGWSHWSPSHTLAGRASASAVATRVKRALTRPGK